ncbi:FAD/NAD-P-binding domain-containing protein [Lentinula edodes]|nr:FAD/NAD-P-binding domain-containing protein [Lentinula edodes]
MPKPDITRIAIVGAGIGGLSAALSLRRLPNVDVQVFEQTHILREVGASIALGPNGLRGLEEMGALNAISDEIAFRSDHGFPMVFKHWKTGNVLVKDEHSPFVTERRHHTARYFHPHLQQAIADTIPVDTIHLGKRLVSIHVSLFSEDEQQPASEGVLLTFEDGSEHVADLVVGADGVHSTLRSLFLPDYKLEPTSQMALRAVFNEAHIHDLISRNPEIRNSVHVVGPDRNFFSSMLGKGKFTVVGLGYHSVEEEEEEGENTAWKGKKWDDVVDVESFRNEYKDWNPWITDLLDRIPSNSLRVHPGWASNQVPPPIHAGRIVLLGDAFHPHGGALAAGGSLAIDDSIALFLALQHVQQSSTPSTSSSSSSDVLSNSRSIEASARRRLSTSELSHALDLYASARLPHSSRVFGVVERMRENVAKPGRLWDEEKIQEWARDKKEVVWLHEHDVHKAFVDALNSEYIS